MKEVEQPESEHCAWSFPSCREPSHMHELNMMESRGTGFVTEAVGDANGVNTRDIKEGEFGWD